MGSLAMVISGIKLKNAKYLPYIDNTPPESLDAFWTGLKGEDGGEVFQEIEDLMNQPVKH
jgi:hypothetical protein